MTIAEPSETERYIARWHEIVPPSPAGVRMAEQLDESVAAHARLRLPPLLDGAPGDFAATMRALAGPAGPLPPAGPNPLAGCGLAARRDALRAGTLGAVEALEASWARIDRLDGMLNAVLWQDRAAAEAQAVAADRRHAAGGTPTALHGVPLAHKDLFGDAGRPQTAGAQIWRNHRATATATVLARLGDAGSIAFGGLNMGEFAQNPTGHNPHFGDCINPWNHAAIAGGSSSGSAVAVAAGYTTGSLGTDTGGSIRLPATCCGVTGLKPTFGLISRAGVVPLCASLDCVGPIARTALDCAILLDVVAGADPADPTCAERPRTGYEAGLTGAVAGVRIGVPTNWFFDEATWDVREAIDTALALLQARGAVLRPVHVPLLDEITTLGGTMARAEAAALYAGFMRDVPRHLAPHVAARLYPGYAIPATCYIDAVQRRPQILSEVVGAVFDRVDVIATPTLRARAPTRAETDVDSMDPGTEQRFFAVGGNVRPINYLGLPALTMPCGLDATGVPIGLQLFGRPFAEALLLRIADAYQRDAGPPPFPTFAGVA